MIISVEIEDKNVFITLFISLVVWNCEGSKLKLRRFEVFSSIIFEVDSATGKNVVFIFISSIAPESEIVGGVQEKWVHF